MDINDIITLERIQRRPTKFILNDYCFDYKNRLIKLKLLPLMRILDLISIVKFLKSTDAISNFQVSNFFNLVSKSSTQSSTFT